MAFIENFLAPLFQATITLGIFVSIGIGLYFALGKTRSNRFFLWVKYKIFKRPYSPAMVEWAMEMLEEDVPEEELRARFYLTNKFKPSQFVDGYYIYNQVKELNKMKGGI